MFAAMKVGTRLALGARVSHVLKGFGDMTERLLKSAPYRATTCGGSASRATLRTPANS
jgi:hypothetical protein